MTRPHRAAAPLALLALAPAAALAGGLAQVASDGGGLTLRVEGVGGAPVVQVLLDADADPATGFAAEGIGADVMVEGATVYRHDGDPTAWTWTSAGPVERTDDGGDATFAVPAAALAGAAGSFPAVARTLSADYATTLARMPAAGSATIAYDAAAGPATRPAELAPPKANRDLPARQRFAEATSFYTYYGSGRVPELSHYDVAVLHTPQMDRADVGRLGDLGVVTVGYLSVGEDDVLRDGDGTGPDGKASWYFDRDGDAKPDKNGNWNSYFADAADPKWRADRVAQAVSLVNDYGFDGIFLDTIDTAQLYPTSAAGMTQLVKELRDALPDAVIVLNQGWAVLPDAAQYADGIMLESFTATWDFEGKSYVMNLPQSLDYHTRRVDGLLNPVARGAPAEGARARLRREGRPGVRSRSPPTGRRRSGSCSPPGRSSSTTSTRRSRARPTRSGSACWRRPSR